jgi:hypothetical protein
MFFRSSLSRRHEDMSARLLEYAVDQQCIDISREQLQLIHNIISGGSSSSSGCLSSSNHNGSSGHLNYSESSWLLQVRTHSVTSQAAVAPALNSDVLSASVLQLLQLAGATRM